MAHGFVAPPPAHTCYHRPASIVGKKPREDASVPQDHSTIKKLFVGQLSYDTTEETLAKVRLCQLPSTRVNPCQLVLCSAKADYDVRAAACFLLHTHTENGGKWWQMMIKSLRDFYDRITLELL